MRTPCYSLLGLLLALAAGCGESTPKGADFGSEDGKQIAMLIESLNDENHSGAKLKATFASGMSFSKNELKLYPRYRYDMKGRVTINGDTATGTVAIEPQAGGNPVEKEWNFVKEGDRWKVKSAPLP